MAGSPSIGQVQLDLILNSQNFRNQLQSSVRASVNQAMSSQMRSQVTSTFSKLGKFAAAAFSVKALVDFGKQAIELGSNLAEVQNVVDVTFSSMSADIDKFAKKAIDSFGMSETVAKRYAGTVGSMAQSFGFTEKEAYTMATTLTGLSGDVASFYNLTSDEAFEKLKGVFTGETQGLKSLGVVMTQTALDDFALAQGMGKTTKSMTEQEKVALRYAFVQDKLKFAIGDFTRSQDGWANQTRILSQRWDAFKTSIGQSLILVFTPLLKMLNTIIAGLAALADAFNNTMQKMFGKKAETSGAGIVEQAEAMEGLAGSTSDVGTEAQKAAKKMKSLMGFDQLNILSSSDDTSSSSAASVGGGAGSYDIKGLYDTTDGIEEMGNAFEKVKNKIKEFIASSKVLQSVVNNIKRYCDNIREFITRLVGNLTDLGKMVLDDIYYYFTKPFQDNEDEIAEFVDDVLGLYNDFVEGVEDAINDVVELVVQLYEEHISPFIRDVTDGISDIMNTVLEVWNKYISPVLHKIGTKLKDLWDNTIQPTIKDIMDIIGDVIDLIRFLWNTIIQPFIKFLAEVLGPVLAKIIEIAYDIFEKFVKGAAEQIGYFKEFIHGIIEFIQGVFTGDWRRAWDGLASIVRSIFSSVVSILKNQINNVIALINGAINGINRIHVKLPDALGGKYMGFNIPNIPYLAQGGYVGPNSPRLAVIGDNRHEGEIVAPESKISAAVSTEMTPVITMLQQLITAINKQDSNSGDIVIPIYLDNSLLDSYVVNTQRRAILRSGGV